MILDGFIHVFLTFVDIFEKYVYTFLITFLEHFKGHFCSPPAPKFAFECKLNLPIFFNLPGFFLFVFPRAIS